MSCVENHSCSSTEDFRGSWCLPSRLLDVGNLNSDRVKLVITSRENISDFRYAALSYCWGTSTPFTTKLSTLDSRLQGFSVFEMPLTLRETVQVTRELGLRYLWIDALCIFQGSQDDAATKAACQPSMLRAKKDNNAAKADWQLESARMHKVYGQAFLTIVAAGASDMNGGLFHGSRSCLIPSRGQGLDPMQSKENATISLDPNGTGSRDVGFHHQSIFSRGWALQEWVLSARLLVFTTTQMYFICNQYSSIRAHKALLFRFPRSPEVVTNKDWRSIVQSFCARDLTKPEDKLPALSGLAKRFSELSNGALGDYRAGLWQNSIHLDILWQRDDAGAGFALMLPIPHKMGRSRYQGRARAPSWSWAAVDGPITFRGDLRTPKRRILCETKPVKGHDLFGQIESGTLVVHCPFKMASIIFRNGNPMLSYDGKTCPGFWSDDPTEIIHLANTEYDDEERKLYCLGLAGRDDEWLGIVVRSDQETGHFLRVGFFFTSTVEFEEADERDFTII